MLKTDAEAEEVLALRNSGMTIRDVADRLGWSVSKVNRREVRAKRNIGKTLSQCQQEITELRQIVYALRVTVAELKGAA